MISQEPVVIPEKAIDEAWDKLHENPTRPINVTYSVLEAALEAAAPHMLAQAWDECLTSDTPWINPYRTQA